MTPLDPHADGASADLITENIERLKALFPELVTEGPAGVSVNVDMLKSLVGDQTLTDAEEKYGLTWHGKRRARQLALTPSTGTLRPCPEESVDWESTQNLMIEGDNLEVLKLLQKSYAGKVKLIYIDPPYNTGHEFIYPDDFTDSIRNYMKLVGQTDGKIKYTTNSDSSGRYHTSWLNMMYPRIKLMNSLLSANGAIFISIDDCEVTSLRRILDEIFGEENFVATLIWQKVFSPKNTAIHFSEDHDYIICYAKSKENWMPELLPRSDSAKDRYRNPDNDKRGNWMSSDLTARNYYSAGQYIVTGPTGKQFGPGKGRYWRSDEDSFKVLDADGRIWWGEDESNMPRLKRFISEVKDGVVPQTLLLHTLVGNTQEAKKELLQHCDFEKTENVLNSVKPTRLLRHLIRIGTNRCDNDIVMDFFAGSGPTGHATIIQNDIDGGNRRYVLVQLPETLPEEETKLKTIADLTKSRLRSVAKQIKTENPLFTGDLGFRVLKLDSSNLNIWDPNRQELPSSLLASIEHIKPDRSEQDLLYELLLKRGLDLCVPIEQKVLASKTVHSIGAGVLLVCLAERIAREEVEELAQGLVAWHKELATAGESTCIFRDSAFVDDVAKTNLAAILEQHGLSQVRSL